jgi:uncharacterized membrane protein YfcA
VHLVAHWLPVLLIGAGVGFLGGLFGKGGSAVATPLLAAVGIPPVVALAAPLPATIPGTLAALRPYWRVGLVDRRVVAWSIGVGLPATIVGAVATRWIGGGPLVTTTDVVVAALGLRFLLRRERHEVVREVAHEQARMVVVAAVVGLAAGLLANSGGFLLAPLYVAALRMPMKPAFGSSLAVSCALAIPGTIVHAALGHIDWAVVGVFAVASVPLSSVGARLALRTQAGRLERVYGGVLAVLGIGLLLVR